MFIKSWDIAADQPVRYEIQCHRRLWYPDLETIRYPRSSHSTCTFISSPFCFLHPFIRATANEQDSQVEIDAKIAAGYFGGAKDVKTENLHLTIGRAWEDLEH